MTRAEHMRWCKERAREFIAASDPKQAVTSMLSDLGKHPETKGAAKGLESMAVFAMQSTAEASRFIEGFPD